MEKILSIVETSFTKEDNDASWSTEYDGFMITTEVQVIKMGISNSQHCCENWGYLMSEDDVTSFVGADLISISVVDKGLNKKCIEVGERIEDGCVMFINIETSNGLLQFVAYNSHNGYYGHSAFVKSSMLKHEETL